MPTTDYKNAKGKNVRGVTSIISDNIGWGKQNLIRWAHKMGKQGLSLDEARSSAATAGSIAHFLIEMEILKGIPVTSTELEEHFGDVPARIMGQGRKGFENWKKWAAAVSFTPISIEEHLVSDKLNVGGTPDMIAMIGGDLCVVDWKSSRGVYVDHVIQCATYVFIWNEVHPDNPITGGFHICQFGKDSGKFAHHWYDMEIADFFFDIFKLLRKLEEKREAEVEYV